MNAMVKRSMWPDDNPVWVTEHLPSFIKGTPERIIVTVTERQP